MSAGIITLAHGAFETLWTFDRKPEGQAFQGQQGICKHILSCIAQSVDNECLGCSLLEGKSGVVPITKFDASQFPTNFAAQIGSFDHEK